MNKNNFRPNFECPLCGEGRGKNWHYCSCNPEQPEPEEGWCDFCGFSYQQFSRCAYDDMLKALDEYFWHLEDNIELVDEEIERLQNFKAKIPELKKRINFDALREMLGWTKSPDGLGWSKKGGDEPE